MKNSAKENSQNASGFNAIIITSKPKLHLINFSELWLWRELFFIFVWRDLKVRYKQTFLGVLWVVLQPLVTTGVFTIFFGRLAKIPSDNMPYELFAFIGLVFWVFFSGSLTQTSNSMIENLQIIKKVYFPKEILPISASITGLVDLFINFIVLLIIAVLFGFRPSPLTLLILPVSTLIALLASSGIGMFLASINVKYRDVRYVLPFFIQTMLFITPVIYPVSTVRESYRPFLALNPMTGVIEAMRKVIIGSTDIRYDLLIISAVSAVCFFLLGIAYFRITERFFADIA